MICFITLSFTKIILAEGEANWKLINSSESCMLVSWEGSFWGINGSTGLIIHDGGNSGTLKNDNWELKNRYSTIKFIFDDHVYRTVRMQVRKNRVNFSLTNPHNLKSLFERHNSLTVQSKSGKEIASYSLNGFKAGYKSFQKCNGIKTNSVVAKNKPSLSNSSNSTTTKKKSTGFLIPLLALGAVIAASNGDQVSAGFLEAMNPSNNSNSGNNTVNKSSTSFN